jgi:ubiquinone biosynthesis protein UbiJ
MSLGKTIDELERHIDYAASYIADVKSELEDLEGKYMNELADYIDQIDTLNEQNELLEEQVENLNRKNAIFELENMELRLRIEVYAVDL